MPGPLVDLVSGVEWEPGSAPLIPGRVMLADNGKGVLVNGLPACFADRVVARRDGTWALTIPGKTAVGGEFPSALLTATLDAEAIAEMGRTFSELRDSRACWSQWATLSPLAPRVAEFLRVRPFDQAIQDRLVFLESVCQRPRSHLRVDEEMTSVPRVRKVARTAIVRLVSHKEDWDRPTVLGVRPRRVLALVAEDDVDIYENRVAARLIDHLAMYLRLRLEQLARIRSMIEQSSEHAASAAGGHFWRQRRLCDLWAGAVGDTRAEQSSKRTADLVESLYGRVRKLFDSPLYRGVPVRSGPVQLRYTNVFESDSLYREVAKLWREWSRLGVSRPPTEEQYYESRQAVCDGSAWFGWLLVVRALDQLGVSCDSSSEHSAVDCDELSLRGAAGAVSVLPPRDGAVVIRVNDRRVRVVCLPTKLEGLDPTLTVDVIDDMERMSRSAAEDEVLVLLVSSHGPAAEGNHEWRADAGHRAGPWEPGINRSSRLGVLPVSPWDIGSVERVARALRWHLWSPMLLQYPPTVQFGTDRPRSLPAWVEATARPDVLRVLRPPEGRERSLGDLLRECRSEGITRLQRQNPKGVRQGTELVERQVEAVRASMETALAQCGRLRTCPTCRTAGAHFRQIGQYDCYECHCESCDSMWGVYRCLCGARFPVIRLKDSADLVASMANDRSSGWFDRVFGSDALACVCPLAGGKGSFVCPSCGKCGCGTNAHAADASLANAP